MRFAAAVEVRALEGIADPEAATIERELPLLGFDAVKDMHVGRVFRFVVEATDADAARATAEELADRLLANPVIQRAEVAVRPLEAEGTA